MLHTGGDCGGRSPLVINCSLGIFLHLFKNRCRRGPRHLSLAKETDLRKHTKLINKIQKKRMHSRKDCFAPIQNKELQSAKNLTTKIKLIRRLKKMSVEVQTYKIDGN